MIATTCTIEEVENQAIPPAVAMVMLALISLLIVPYLINSRRAEVDV